jgi:hypothetical protein
MALSCQQLAFLRTVLSNSAASSLLSQAVRQKSAILPEGAAVTR